VKYFKLGTRVVVSSEGGWKNDFSGTICSEAEPVETLQGNENFFWVEFEEPQEDINGSEKYTRAQILSCYINETT